MSGSKIFGASLIAVGTAIQVVYVFWVALQLVSRLTFIKAFLLHKIKEMSRAYPG